MGRTVERSARVLACIAALAFVVLVVRFDWVCDDAYITFRYAKNWVAGAGLVFNPGESPPIEGYSNFLWVLVSILPELAGLDAALVARVLSALAGAALLWLVWKALAALDTPPLARAAAVLFLAALPAFATWSTSGLETMAFAAALFAGFERACTGRARLVAPALALSIAVLLRADGFLLVAALLGCAIAASLVAGERERLRALCGVALVVALVVAAQFLARRFHYGDWLPNTARAKVAFGWPILERGGLYALSFLLTFPAVLLACFAALALAFRCQEVATRTAIGLALAVFGYAIAVGGDFMAMGRFLVPALAPLAFTLGRALSGFDARRIGLAIGACALCSLPGAFERTLVPRAWIERFDFRWSSGEKPDEFEKRRSMHKSCASWAATGKAMAVACAPGESLTTGGIGAIGYFSGLWIHDWYGLVNREAFEPPGPEERRSPGHQRRVPIETLLAKNPTYLDAALVPADDPWSGLRPNLMPEGSFAHLVRHEWLDVAGIEGVAPGTKLRLVRYAPHF